MVLNKRTINFTSLIDKIEVARAVRDQYAYHTYLQNITGKNCELCELSLNPYSIYLNQEKAICPRCFNDYVDAEEYLPSLELFEHKVLRINSLIDELLTTQHNNVNIDLVKKLFKGQSLTEIEQMIGMPKTFGSFDFGIEAGTWRLDISIVEIWFKNQICTDIQLV